MYILSFHNKKIKSKTWCIDRWLLFVGLALFTIACKKENEPTQEAIISNNYQFNISSKNKAIDSVTIDIDNDGVKDIALVSVNTQLYTYAIQPNYHVIYIDALQNNIEFMSDGAPYPDCLAGTYCFWFLRGLGKGVREFKDAKDNVRRELEESIAEKDTKPDTNVNPSSN